MYVANPRSDLERLRARKRGGNVGREAGQTGPGGSLPTAQLPPELSAISNVIGSNPNSPRRGRPTPVPKITGSPVPDPGAQPLGDNPQTNHQLYQGIDTSQLMERLSGNPVGSDAEAAAVNNRPGVIPQGVDPRLPGLETIRKRLTNTPGFTPDALGGGESPVLPQSVPAGMQKRLNNIFKLLESRGQSISDLFPGAGMSDAVAKPLPPVSPPAVPVGPGNWGFNPDRMRR